MRADQELILQQQAPGHDSTDGTEVLATARLHMDIAVMAMACGTNRAAVIQVGNGNDGDTRYPGSCNGFLKQGVYVEASGGGNPNHNRMLNTIGTAVGLRNAAGGNLDDFGDPALTKGVLSELIA